MPRSKSKPSPATLSSLEDLHLDQANANKGTARGRAIIEQSVEDLGAGRSILSDRDGNVIAGNQTLKAAREAGLGVRVIDTDGSELVVVRRTDLQLDSPKGRAMALADNRAGQVGLEWDEEALRAHAAMMEDGDFDLRADDLFTPEEASWLSEVLDDESPVDSAPPDPPEHRESYQDTGSDRDQLRAPEDEGEEDRADVMVTVGPYRFLLERDQWDSWHEDLRQKSGFSHEEIRKALKVRLGMADENEAPEA